MSESDRSVPFFNVPKADRQKAIQKMKLYSEGDPEKLSVDMVKTAFKSLIGDGESKIAAVPLVVVGPFGPTFRIPIKGLPDPALTSLQHLKMQVKYSLSS